jgi:hypothetical protein
MKARWRTTGIGIASAVLAASLALSAPARAAQIDFDGVVHAFGPLATPQTIAFDETTTTGSTPVTTTIDGSSYDHFDYIYSFSVTSPGSKISEKAFSSGGDPTSEIHAVFYENDPSGRPLFTHGDTNQVNYPANPSLIDIQNFDGFLTGGQSATDASITLNSLNAGMTYYLRVFGVIATGSALHITGSLQTAAVAATPIPTALLMFLTALGGLGFTGWRRQRQARE